MKIKANLLLERNLLICRPPWWSVLSQNGFTVLQHYSLGWMFWGKNRPVFFVKRQTETLEFREDCEDEIQREGTLYLTLPKTSAWKKSDKEARILIWQTCALATEMTQRMAGCLFPHGFKTPFFPLDANTRSQRKHTVALSRQSSM